MSVLNCAVSLLVLPLVAIDLTEAEFVFHVVLKITDLSTTPDPLPKVVELAEVETLLQHHSNSRKLSFHLALTF